MLKIDPIGVGENEQTPQAIAEFVAEPCIEPGGGPDAFLRHHQLHQITKVADESLREFGARPRATAALRFEFGVKLAHAARAGGEGGERARHQNFRCFTVTPLLMSCFNDAMPIFR